MLPGVTVVGPSLLARFPIPDSRFPIPESRVPLFSLLFSTVAFAALAHGDGLPAASPTSVGMSAERLEKIDHVIERGIKAG